MKRNKAVPILKRCLLYFGGMFLMTIGLNVSKLSNLGITVTSTIARTLELITPMTLGVASIVVYIVFIVLQAVLLRKKFTPINILGLPVTIFFGVFVDIMGSDPDAFGHLLIWLPKPETYPMQLVYMIISLLFSGIGIYLYTRPNWVPMPPEGLTGAISTVTGLSYGNSMTLMDCVILGVALILQFIYLGGIAAFIGDNVIIREGTLVTAVFFGQIIRLMTKLTGRKIDKWMNS